MKLKMLKMVEKNEKFSTLTKKILQKELSLDCIINSKVAKRN